MSEVQRREDPIQGKIVHEYDGIEEADNDLPRWWLFTLFGAIVFAAGYWFYYHEYAVAPLPREQYAADVAAAAESGGEVTSDLLETLASSSPAEVERGGALFAEHCAVCHGDKAQGNIGPNLTDDRWLHGGAAMDIHTTIANGVGAKGMPAWGSTLGPNAVRSLAVFVTSLRDTNVPGKEPQGDVYTGAAATPSPSEQPAAEPAGEEAAAPGESEPAAPAAPAADAPHPAAQADSPLAGAARAALARTD